LHDYYSLIDFGIELMPTFSFARHYSYTIANKNKILDNKKINKPKKEKKRKHYSLTCKILLCAIKSIKLEESSIFNMGAHKVKTILGNL